MLDLLYNVMLEATGRLQKQAPGGVPSVIADERCEEYSPGLDKDLLALIKAGADIGPRSATPTARSPETARRPTSSRRADRAIHPAA